MRQWIEDVLGETLEAGCDNMMEQLKSGVILCNLMNALVPGSISKINKGKLAFHQIDNIGKFLTAASAAGLPSHDTFTTPELFESKMPSAVIQALVSLGRVAQKLDSYSGPTIGPKLAESRTVEHDADAAAAAAAGGTLADEHARNTSGLSSGIVYGKVTRM